MHFYSHHSIVVLEWNQISTKTFKNPDFLNKLLTLGKVKNDQKTFSESYILNSEKFYILNSNFCDCHFSIL